VVCGVSFEPDDITHEVSTRELLHIIAKQLILMNARIEAAFETDICIEDLEDGGE
jgi:hypothetical protein